MTERARWAWLVVVLIVAIGGLAASGILYTNSVERRGVADLCELVRAYDDAYRADPPATETGRRIADQTRRYAERNCR